MNGATMRTLAVAVGVAAVASIGQAAEAASPATGPSSGCESEAIRAPEGASLVGSRPAYRRCGTERRAESHVVEAVRTPAAVPPPSGEVPRGWTELIDETGRLAVSVPSRWTAADVSPVVDDRADPLPISTAISVHF
jgi:hypothetical protein